MTTIIDEAICRERTAAAVHNVAVALGDLLKLAIEATAHHKEMEAFINTVDFVGCLPASLEETALAWSHLAETLKNPRKPWQSVFKDFDYDYGPLITELGPDWEDGTWGNDTCPSAVYKPDTVKGIKLFFDYADPKLSQTESCRADGTLKRFGISDMEGTDYFQSDDWTEIVNFCKTFDGTAPAE